MLHRQSMNKRATHKIKPVVFHRQNGRKTLNINYFLKKRIFNNNHMILNITFAHYKLLLQLQCVQEQFIFQ
jgi:hypothetical protein